MNPISKIANSVSDAISSASTRLFDRIWDRSTESLKLFNGNPVEAMEGSIYIGAAIAITGSIGLIGTVIGVMLGISLFIWHGMRFVYEMIQ